MTPTDFDGRYRGNVVRLNQAFLTGDEAAFEVVLDELFSGRRSAVLDDVARLSESLHEALTRFRSDSRVAALAQKEIPDARLRLEHVLAMTESAANKTLDLIERSVPLADATVRDATSLLAALDEKSHNDIRRFLEETCCNFEAVRSNLGEVMMTQSFQDLTGQILRGVQRLIGEVESTLEELARITGFKPAPIEQMTKGTDLEGPAVPGITQNAVSDQGDVDDLIAGLGI
jgi:chemotaxis protein CheZ